MSASAGAVALWDGVARERRGESQPNYRRGNQKLEFPQMNLDQLTKGDARKIQMARRLRQETTMPLHWIADRLQVGSVPYTAKLIMRIKNRDPFHSMTREWIAGACTWGPQRI